MQMGVMVISCRGKQVQAGDTDEPGLGKVAPSPAQK